jgi:dTDP-4-amino-4,6-dideoxygalactose transaminase
VKLTRLEQWTEARRKLAAEYDILLEDAGVLGPAVIPDVRHVYCLYTIQASARDELQQGLEGAGIKTAVHYPVPIHLMPAYTDERYRAGNFPIAEAAARAVLSLPLYPHMNSGQVRQVAHEVDRLSRKAGQETLLSRR